VPGNNLLLYRLEKVLYFFGLQVRSSQKAAPLKGAR